MLARKCISLLGDGGVLKRDICGLGEAAKERATIDPQVIEDKLPKEARYAVLYWVHHLKRSAVTLHDEHIVLQFLRNHLLHWLEALSLLGRISESIKLIGDLQVLYIVSNYYLLLVVGVRAGLLSMVSDVCSRATAIPRSLNFCMTQNGLYFKLSR
jgi:hypothetical protein